MAAGSTKRPPRAYRLGEVSECSRSIVHGSPETRVTGQSTDLVERVKTIIVQFLKMSERLIFREIQAGSYVCTQSDSDVQITKLCYVVYVLWSRIFMVIDGRGSKAVRQPAVP